tara:strand:- start:13055 stop:14101 length:1047 start_codon:yes stop_codon:yes gene_type:complete
MFSKIRPLLFKLDPELAHDLAIKALKTNFFFKKKNQYSEILKIKIFNKEIKNPIGIAAGFDKDAEVYNSLFDLGFGFVEVGTITPVKQIGNAKPRVFRLEEDNALINRLGFNNSGSEKIRSRILQNKPKGLFGVNIGPNWNSKDRSNDYIICFNQFFDIVDYITINISSPNTEGLRNFHSLKELENLLDKIYTARTKTKSLVSIALKVSPDIDVNDVEDISRILLKYNVDAVIVSNTTDGNRDKLINQKKYQKGGLSGKPLFDISNNLIRNFYKNLMGKVKIIGVGGVDSGETAFQKFLNGANLVQLYTGMVFKGPSIASKINEDLEKILLRNKIKKLSDIIGKYKLD